MRNPGHTLDHSSLLKLAMKYPACILESSITVKQGMCAWIFQDSFIKGFINKGIVVALTDGIRNDAPVAEIQDSTKVDFVHLYSLVPFEFRDISAPLLVWLVCVKIAIQEIFGQELSFLCMAGTSTGGIFNGGSNASGLTDSPDTFIIYLNPVIVLQIIIDSSVTFVRTLCVNRLNQFRQPAVLFFPRTMPAREPPIIGASSYTKNRTAPFNGNSRFLAIFCNSAILFTKSY